MWVFDPRIFFGFSPSAVEAISGVFVPGTAATIEQFQNFDSTPDPEWGEFWRYYWRVNIPADANIRWQTCTSTCDSAIRTWGDTVAECVIDKLCPSHTVVVFAYPEGK